MRTAIAVAIVLALPALADAQVQPAQSISGTVVVRPDGSVRLQTGPGLRDYRVLEFVDEATCEAIKAYNGQRVTVYGQTEIAPGFPFKVFGFLRP